MRLAGLGRDHVHLADDHDVIVEGDEAAEDGQAGEPEQALIGGGGEEVELGREASEEGEAGKGEEADGDGSGHEGVSVGEAGEVGYLLFFLWR